MIVHKGIRQIQRLLNLKQPGVNVAMLTVIIIVQLLHFTRTRIAANCTPGPRLHAINSAIKLAKSWSWAHVLLSAFNLSITTNSYCHCNSLFKPSFWCRISHNSSSSCAYCSLARRATSSFIITCCPRFSILVFLLLTGIHSRNLYYSLYLLALPHSATNVTSWCCTLKLTNVNCDSVEW